MVFYVVVPIIFGFFANFFIPYHIGSKDVAFPRLNSMGFWLQPLGFLILARPAFLRPDFLKSYDVKKLHLNLNKELTYKIDSFSQLESVKGVVKDTNSNVYIFSESENDFLNNRNFISKNNSWYSITNLEPLKDDKTITFVKCSPANQVMSGWTFITPFSAKLDYTAVGS